MGQIEGANTPLLTKLLTRAVEAGTKQSATSETKTMKTVIILIMDNVMKHFVMNHITFYVWN